MFEGQWESDPYFTVKVSNASINENYTKIEYKGDVLIFIANSNAKAHYGTIFGTFDNSSKTMNGSITILELGVDYTFTLSEYTKQQQLYPKIYYSFILSFMYLLTITAWAKHFHKAYENPNFAEKTSMGTIALVETFEIFFSLWQLKKALEIPLGFDYIFIASFWSFATFMFVQSKLLPIVFRSQNSNLTSFGFQVSSRVISNFQTRFVFLCIIAVISLKILKEFYVVTVPLMHLVFLPQIITNSIYGYKDSFSIYTYASILFSKGMIAMYLFGCPSNFMRYQPNYQLLMNVLVVLLLQFMVLYWQSFKPRFLVPKRYRPVSYNYFKTSNEEHGLANELDPICIICMTPLNFGQSLNEPIVNTHKTMHTPCNHRFHQDCLTQWMAIKLECPTCRAKIPIFDENE